MRIGSVLRGPRNDPVARLLFQNGHDQPFGLAQIALQGRIGRRHGVTVLGAEGELDGLVEEAGENLVPVRVLIDVGDIFGPDGVNQAVQRVLRRPGPVPEIKKSGGCRDDGDAEGDEPGSVGRFPFSLCFMFWSRHC